MSTEKRAEHAAQFFAAATPSAQCHDCEWVLPATNGHGVTGNINYILLVNGFNMNI